MTMNLKCRVGSLPNGKAFQTLLTRRYGMVLGAVGNGKERQGIHVALEEPDEERILHEDVMVEAQF